MTSADYFIYWVGLAQKPVVHQNICLFAPCCLRPPKTGGYFVHQQHLQTRTLRQSAIDCAYAIRYNTNMKLPSIVIDTNVIISAQRSQRGASAKLISLIGTGLFEIHVSIPLILEYEAVLFRHRISLGLSQDDIVDLVDALCALSIHHKKIHFRWRPFLPDENDEFILDLAVVAQCDYIVTYNQKDFVGVDKFGVQVVDARTFLQLIGVIS